MSKFRLAGAVLAVALVSGSAGAAIAPATGGDTPALAASPTDSVDAPAVGWQGQGAGDAGDTLRLGGAPNVDTVAAPASRTVDGTTYLPSVARLSASAGWLSEPQWTPAGRAVAPARHATDYWGLLKQVAFGGLPEPATWALLAIGFGMIGVALRGFVVANRRLARLQPDDSE